MDITATHRDDVLVVRPRGRFDAHTIGDFRAALASNARRDSKDVAVDLTQVEFVDEAALAALVAARAELNAADGDLVLASPSQSVRIILELTGRSNDFLVFPSDDTAIGAVRNAGVVA